jgi:hypothetical protein
MLYMFGAMAHSTSAIAQTKQVMFSNTHGLCALIETLCCFGALPGHVISKWCLCDLPFMLAILARFELFKGVCGRFALVKASRLFRRAGASSFVVIGKMGEGGSLVGLGSQCFSFAFASVSCLACCGCSGLLHLLLWVGWGHWGRSFALAQLGLRFGRRRSQEPSARNAYMLAI